MWKLYALELESGCYYVGMALNPELRFIDHIAGQGSNFTKLHKPIRIAEIRCSGTDDRDAAYKLESEMTLDYGIKFGGDKVKGGKYLIHSKLTRKIAILNKAIRARQSNGDNAAGLPASS